MLLNLDIEVCWNGEIRTLEGLEDGCKRRQPGWVVLHRGGSHEEGRKCLPFSSSVTRWAFLSFDACSTGWVVGWEAVRNLEIDFQLSQVYEI